MARTGRARPNRRRLAAHGPRHHRAGTDCVRGVHFDARHRHRDPGRSGRHHDPDRGRVRDRHHGRDHGLVCPAERTVRRPAHPRRRRHVQDAVRGRHARGDDVHGRDDAHRGRDGPAARGDRRTDARGAVRDVPRCWRGGWPVGRRRDRIDRRCPDEDARRPDRRTQAVSSPPVAARTAAQDGVRYAARCAARRWGRAGRAGAEGLPARRWPAPPRPPHRPRDDAGADHGAGEAPRRALQPSAAVGRPLSTRGPMGRRDTDCRPRRNRGTARHWCGCGEWGVCVRSFENCKWYSWLRSDLEESATPQQA